MTQDSRGKHTFSYIYSVTVERFPDRIIPSYSELATRSDDGSQYTSERFASTLKIYEMRHEVTGKNRPDHNAYIEAFHKSTKEDSIWQHDFQTFQEANHVICKFFHVNNVVLVVILHL